MTHESLFDELDKVADALHADETFRDDEILAEMIVEFRQAQKRRKLNISDEEAQDLFRTWGLHYIARREQLRREFRATLDNMPRTPSEPFICNCGAIIGTPAKMDAHLAQCDQRPRLTSSRGV